MRIKKVGYGPTKTGELRFNPPNTHINNNDDNIYCEKTKENDKVDVIDDEPFEVIDDEPVDVIDDKLTLYYDVETLDLYEFKQKLKDNALNIIKDSNEYKLLCKKMHDASLKGEFSYEVKSVSNNVISALKYVGYQVSIGYTKVGSREKSVLITW